MERVIDLVGLSDAGGRDDVHELRDRAGIRGAVGVEAGAVHTPNWKGAGVGRKPRAWSASALKPSWPASTTVKPQPLAGCPSDAFGTRTVMNREIELPLIETVPRVAPLASS